MKSRLSEIIQALRLRPFYIKELARHLNASYTTVWKWVKELEKQGKVEIKEYARAKVVIWKG